jgi:hypothetical protein
MLRTEEPLSLLVISKAGLPVKRANAGSSISASSGAAMNSDDTVVEAAIAAFLPARRTAGGLSRSRE